MAIVGAFTGGSGDNPIVAGSGVLNLNWITTTGLNMEGATFNIVGPKTYTAQADSNGYAQVTVDTGTYTVSVTHDGDYFGDEPKTVTVDSREEYTLTWVAAKASAQVVTFTSPTSFPSATYEVSAGGVVYQSGSNWPASIAFTLYPRNYQLKVTYLGQTLTYPFTVGAEGSTIDLTSSFSHVTLSMNKPIAGVTITLDGTDLDVDSGVYLVKGSHQYTMSFKSPEYAPGFPIVTLSASSTLTASATEVSVPVTVAGVLTLFTTAQNLGSLQLKRGQYRIVAVGGGGAGSDLNNYSNSGGGGGHITDVTKSVSTGAYPLTIGAGGKRKTSSNGGSGGATSLGTLVSASGGGGGTQNGGGDGGSGGGGGTRQIRQGGYVGTLGAPGGDGSFGGGGGGGGSQAYIGSPEYYPYYGSGGTGGTFGGDGGDGGRYDGTKHPGQAGSAGTNAPSSDAFFYDSGGSNGGAKGGSPSSGTYIYTEGGGGGGGYSAKGGIGAYGTTNRLGAGGGGGGAHGGLGGYARNRQSANGSYADTGHGYGAGGGGHCEDDYNAGGGGGGYGTRDNGDNGDGIAGCLRIQFTGGYV